MSKHSDDRAGQSPTLAADAELPTLGSGMVQVKQQLHLLQQENAVLIRALAKAQQRTTCWLHTLRTEADGQQSRIVRLRAALMVKETELLYLRQDMAALLGTSQKAADLVICQTGCVSHNDHWLQENNQCKRSGQACVLREEPSTPAVQSAAIHSP